MSILTLKLLLIFCGVIFVVGIILFEKWNNSGNIPKCRWRL